MFCNMLSILPFHRPCFVCWLNLHICNNWAEQLFLKHVLAANFLSAMHFTFRTLTGMTVWSSQMIGRSALIRIQIGWSALIRIDQSTSGSVLAVSCVAGWQLSTAVNQNLGFCFCCSSLTLHCCCCCCANKALAAAAYPGPPAFLSWYGRYGYMGPQRENRKQLSCACAAGATEFCNGQHWQGLPSSSLLLLLSFDPRSQRDISQHCREGPAPPTMYDDNNQWQPTNWCHTVVLKESFPWKEAKNWSSCFQLLEALPLNTLDSKTTTSRLSI